MTDETAYHGAILLLDLGLVVATVRPGPGELDAMVGTALDQRLESWPETDRIMARGYTPGNQG